MMKLKYLFVLAVSCMTVICTSSSQAQTTLSNSIQSEINKLSASAALEADSLVSGKTAQVAAVCFITDTEDCGGRGWGATDDPVKPGPIGPDIPPEPVSETCADLGYKLTKATCGTGYTGSNFCPLDSNYFKECKCTEECPTGYQEEQCGSGMLEREKVVPNCKTCYRCVACKDDCPSGYSVDKGVCNTVSSYKTECNSTCYKIISNVCTEGSLDAPAEVSGYKVKIVGYTGCNKPCFALKNDTCPSGFTKTKPGSGKCYDTEYTDYGSACYKEKTCCQSCPSGYSTSNPGGCPDTKTTNCGETCYGSYKPCCDNAIYDCKCTNCTGGSGGVCPNGKYSECNCKPGYQWSGGDCKPYSGLSGQYYYCDGVIRGIKHRSRNVVFGLRDLDEGKATEMTQTEGHRKATNYEFCKDVFGRLPSRDDMWNIDTDLTQLLATNGEAMRDAYYWTGAAEDMAAKTFWALKPSGSSSIEKNTNKHWIRPVLDVY